MYVPEFSVSHSWKSFTVATESLLPRYNELNKIPKSLLEQDILPVLPKDPAGLAFYFNQLASLCQ
jgi:hypothetical protein